VQTAEVRVLAAVAKGLGRREVVEWFGVHALSVSPSGFVP
jgi:hypothetical protein